MANPAIITDRDVRRVDFRIGAGGVDTIVAAIAATAGDRCPAVIDIGIDKRRRVVTDRAILAGILMDHRISGTDGPGSDMICKTVVAGYAVRRDALVAER